MAVCEVCDNGSWVVFNKSGGVILPVQSKAGEAIAEAVRQAEHERTDLLRKDGVYKMPAWIVPPSRVDEYLGAQTKQSNSAQGQTSCKPSGHWGQSRCGELGGDVEMKDAWGFQRQG